MSLHVPCLPPLKGLRVGTNIALLHWAHTCPVAQLTLGKVWKVKNAYDGL